MRKRATVKYPAIPNTPSKFGSCWTSGRGRGGADVEGVLADRRGRPHFHRGGGDPGHKCPCRPISERPRPAAAAKGSVLRLRMAGRNACPTRWLRAVANESTTSGRPVTALQAGPASVAERRVAFLFMESPLHQARSQTAMTGCPTASQLADLVAGRLSPGDHDVIEDHVENCDACRAALELIEEADDPFVIGLRKVCGLGTGPDETLLETVVARVRGLIDSPVAARRAGPRAPFFPSALGDFRILRELGRGGMGVVYEAEQVSLRRRVALKTLPFAAAPRSPAASEVSERGPGRSEPGTSEYRPGLRRRDRAGRAFLRHAVRRRPEPRRVHRRVAPGRLKAFWPASMSRRGASLSRRRTASG